jgi:hypothetical protein
VPHPLLPLELPAGNVTQATREPHAELMNLQTLDVWLCQAPMTTERYKALKPPAPLVKSGHGVATFDFAWFTRSPGATVDGPLATMEIEGLPFVRVARPQALRGFANGDLPTRLAIEKHHVIGFDAGTVLRLARLPDGQYYIQQTASATTGTVDVYPADWTLHQLALTHPWRVTLACPCTVWFFRNMRSFCGPFSLEQLPAAPQAAAA